MVFRDMPGMKLFSNFVFLIVLDFYGLIVVRWTKIGLIIPTF